MKKLKNVHAGEILKFDFMEPMSLTAYALLCFLFTPI